MREPRISQDSENGPVAQADEIEGINGFEELLGFLDGDFRSFSFMDLVALIPDRANRI